MADLLSRLRETDVKKRVGPLERELSRDSLKEFLRSGCCFVASHPQIENVFYRAVHDLMNNIHPSVTGSPLLIEGAVYIGCWLESTGTICTELLSRFCPEVAQACFGIFADFQREDGLLPYKLTAEGPSFRQIQMVTPLARSVWNHYCRNGRDVVFLRKMYEAMSRNDAWLATHRDTRKTGCVEAFCTFDTGHDFSPRFWHVPDTPFMADPARYDPDSPILPFLAPDLTANVYCQRKYLQQMAEELGLDGSIWAEKSNQSLKSLMTCCYDDRDHFFYDRDRNDRFVRVQSDVLMRVMACEVGDLAMFDDLLRRYLLNTKKFFSRFPLTVIALDDPGYDPLSLNYNSWAGKANHLTTIRLPHAFDHHHRQVELTWIMQPILSSLARSVRFSGSINPWTGAEGESQNFSGAMLCLLDYLERLCGIYPTPGDELWFTSLLPYGTDHGQVVADATGYARAVDGAVFELVNDPQGSAVYKDRELLYTLPHGIQIVTGRDGTLKEIVGMSVRTITGEIRHRGGVLPLTVSGNERLVFTGDGFQSIESPGVVLPQFEPVS